ncbi:hypothetical protein [Natronococcus occultus]|uniref:CHAT domain-containing protein n=1 Tax=Natronococcus occultus SP4 TaxID=694430 RepID=L0K4C3_9EURY|nr:hypothetical protein [Natronococcus occultus]AGB39219.1 hypothetical protein Natoc_3492 [Natronococcus occultus SP4]
MTAEPRFEPLDDGHGLTVVDPIENRRCPFRTDRRISLRPVEPTGFSFPVDGAVELTVAELIFPYVVPVYARDPSGEVVLEAEHCAYERLPAGEYVFELMAPIKLYVRATSAVTIASADDRLAFDFGESTEIRLGARSRHERPATTVTTTAEPADLARAVSTFGSALKTRECDRSLPSFRGHPPCLELGSELQIPDAATPPDTGVRLVVPPDRATIYAASPLAHYLAASVEVGSDPRLETDSGFAYPLGNDEESVARTIGRVLEHAFFFDCVARTEGLYPVELHERDELDARLDFAIDEFYEAELGERIETALSIPHERIADLLPRWNLVTHATDEPTNATVLPFLVNELSIVRPAPEARTDDEPAPLTALAIDEFTRSTGAPDSEDDRSYVSPPDADAFGQAWLGSGVPIGANKLFRTAYENGLERSPSDGTAEVAVVCNDPAMAAEFDAGDSTLYGEREKLPFEVAVHRNVTTDRLRELFAADLDFLHYVGHVEDGAFVCKEDVLEAGKLPAVGVDAVLINGCRSYDVGRRVIEQGGVSGIVTLSDVGNRDAIAVGRFVVRLLNNGFTIRDAAALARETHLVGNQYLVVGDGSVTVGQAGSGVPNGCRIEPLDDGRYRLHLQLYHVDSGVGAQYIPYIDGVDRHFLAGTELPPIELSGGSLARFLRLAEIPVRYDGDRYWSTDDRFTEL